MWTEVRDIKQSLDGLSTNVNGCPCVVCDLLLGRFAIGKEQGIWDAERDHGQFLFPCKTLIDVLGRGTGIDENGSFKIKFRSRDGSVDAECFPSVGNSAFARVS